MARTCVICGAEFESARRNKKTCSPDCSRALKKQRDKAWQVAALKDPTFLAYMRERNAEFRSRNPEAAKAIRDRWVEKKRRQAEELNKSVSDLPPESLAIIERERDRYGGITGVLIEALKRL